VTLQQPLRWSVCGTLLPSCRWTPSGAAVDGAGRPCDYKGSATGNCPPAWRAEAAWPSGHPSRVWSERCRCSSGPVALAASDRRRADRACTVVSCRRAPRGIRLGSFEASPCHRGVCREVPSATIPRGVAERGPRVTRGRGRRKPSRASRCCAGESWSPPPGGWQWQVLRPLMLHVQMIEYSLPGLLGNADGVLLSARFRALACMLLSAELGWLWLAVVSRQLEMPIQCGTCPAGIDGR
jgi:hypothetical protein